MKRKISITSFITSLFIAFVVAFFIAPMLHMAIPLLAIILFAFSFIPQPAGAKAGISKEIWISQVMEKYYPDGSFLLSSQDFTSFVEYNKINLAEAGVSPEVLVDNAVYPVPVESRVDNPLELPLRTLDTKNTVVRNLERMEASYNKMESVILGHRMSLQEKAAFLAAWSWAPTSTGVSTPVVAAAGEANLSGYKKLSFQDVLNMEIKFDDMNLPIEGRTMLLNPTHKHDLMLEDLKLYKMVMADGRLFNFKLFSSTATPLYAANGTKQAFGSAKTATSAISSIFWHSREVMRADGTMDVFAKYADPGERGDVIGFQKRFLALPIRNKFVGAIYSNVAS